MFDYRQQIILVHSLPGLIRPWYKTCRFSYRRAIKPARFRKEWYRVTGARKRRDGRARGFAAGSLVSRSSPLHPEEVSVAKDRKVHP